MNGLLPLPRLAIGLLLAVSGCSSARSSQPASSAADLVGLSPPFYVAAVLATCDPPVGWKPDPLKTTSNHTDQVWLSSTRATAYGVIHFRMPLPVGQSLAMSGFISQMRRTEGDATLLARQDDPSLPGIRFIAIGGLYLIRGNLQVSGWDGWAVYAGTLKNGLILPRELDFAVRAREHTRVGSLKNAGN